MSSPTSALRSAVDTALRGSSALSTAMGGTIRLYTEVPTNATLPYVVQGQIQVLHEEEDDCATPKEAFVIINYWSKKSTLDHGAQADAMGEAIIDALDARLSLSGGWTVTVAEVTSENTVTDPDQSSHGTIVFRYLISG